MHSENYWTELFAATQVTLSLAAVTTAVLLLLCPAIAWWFTRTQNKARPVLEALTSLPLILPPTVIGFYLLISISPNGFIGLPWIKLTGESLAFSFTGLVIGSLIYSLPFVLQPLVTSFRNTDERLLEAAASLGASPVTRFLFLVLPMHKRALISVATLGFAHTLGEFGIVLMIGGNLEGKTRVLSIVLFDQVESLRYQDAHSTALFMLAMALITMTLVYRFQSPKTHD
ncbi:MAG: molybdate ABC transporter permease subunit [Pseudomonadales bacterium]|nr:molybdate ABC transporter permease subunit [Pseudomonadales bacterium]